MLRIPSFSRRRTAEPSSLAAGDSPTPEEKKVTVLRIPSFSRRRSPETAEPSSLASGASATKKATTGLLRIPSFSRRSTAAPATEPRPSTVSPPAAHTVSRLVEKPCEESAVGISLETRRGVTHISELTQGGAAERAGCCVGDVVQSVNGIEVDCAGFGCGLLASAPAGFVEVVVTTVAPPLPVKLELMDTLELCPIPVKPDPSDAISLYTVPRDSEKVAVLFDMGFEDEVAARHALQASNGDVQAAVNWLLQENLPVRPRTNVVTS